MLENAVHMFYFAFGSNLDRQQMVQRCPSAEVVALATLPNHALAFTGFSARWGGAVATVAERRGALTEGLLYSIDEADMRALDGYEGHPFAYRRARKYVRLADGKRVLAYIYTRPVDAPDHPSPSYLKVILRAYLKHGFNVKGLERAALQPAHAVAP
jgi:gamma-glutamylcyclotransferase